MRNEWIDGLSTNHSPAPLLEQKQIWAYDVEEMESSSKIDLRDVSWWNSIKDAWRHGALVISKLSKERCISLVVGGNHFVLHVSKTEVGVGPLQPEKHIPTKWVY
jgi:hypothetical protein